MISPRLSMIRFLSVENVGGDGDGDERTGRVGSSRWISCVVKAVGPGTPRPGGRELLVYDGLAALSVLANTSGTGYSPST